MPTVAVLTPDPDSREYAAAWPGLFDRIRDALAGAGVQATATPWTAHVDHAGALREADGVLPLLAWGYHADHARWLRACRTWDAAGLGIANVPSVLAWNSDKAYLARFARAGIAMPPTT